MKSVCTKAHESTWELKTISEMGIKVIIKGEARASLNIKLGKQNIRENESKTQELRDTQPASARRRDLKSHRENQVIVR